ncbi:MAG: glycogen/starch synthase [Candidatus Nanoarchaeia archaeon]
MEKIISNKMQVLAETLFEISWEVCNPVGGIYAVITTKAGLISDYYKNYYCIGPYFKDKADEYLQQKQPPEKFRAVFEELKKEGIIVYYGTWLTDGEPNTFLLDFGGFANKKNEIKKELWDEYKIDSLYSRWEFEEPMLFSYAAGLMLKKLEDRGAFNPERTILQSHEWMTGFSFLKLKSLGSKIKSVFTTHATMLGRSISGSNQDLYGMLGHFDTYQKAAELGVLDKFTAEKAAAQNATIFTTVSEITARESEFILGRKPEVLVLNGLKMDNYPSIEETSIKHVTSREVLREFLVYSFFPYYKFDVTKNLMFYTACRYEFENKGVDMYINALGMLNTELKNTDADRTITAFMFIAVPNAGLKAELLENKNYYKHIKNYVESKSKEIMSNIINDFISGEGEGEDMLSKEFVQEMRRDVLHFKRSGAPIMSTHKLNGPEEQDRIIQACRAAGLNNTREDKVKIILFPAYLKGTDALLNLDFFDVAAGCHLAVFPSYYEPWGYTPLESAALGVPTVTTDLAGFGRFIQEKTAFMKTGVRGIYIIERDGKSKQDSTYQLFEIMKNFSTMDHSERVDNKVRAKELSHLCDWKHLVKNYVEAYNLAILKR